MYSHLIPALFMSISVMKDQLIVLKMSYTS